MSNRAKHDHERREDGREATLEAPRCADADQVAHDEPEIEAARMNQDALQDVGVPTQMRAAQRAGFIQMGVRALKIFAAAPQEPLSPSPTNARRLR